MINPRTGKPMPLISVQVGKLKFYESEFDGTYHITAPCMSGESVYTVAFLGPGKEGCDLKTVGQRPWEVDGVTPAEVFQFCRWAMSILDRVIVSEGEA